MVDKESVRLQLQIAHANPNNVRLVSKAQVAITNLIPGLSVPYQTIGPVADKQVIIGSLFVNFFEKHGGDDLLTNTICFVIDYGN